MSPPKAVATATSRKGPMHPALEKRAIQEELVSGPWGDRYVFFERGDWDTFRGSHSNPEPWHKTQIVDKTSGLIINRWDIEGNRLESYIRPDDPEFGLWGCLRRGHPNTCAGGHNARFKKAKYVYPSKNELGDTSAKRIDVHPAIRERLMANTTEPIYFCLEGCFKADAVAGTGRLAISVPSVTLWELADEHLAPWLPVLRRAPVVYVVPDSDYNPRRKGYGSGNPPVFVNGGEVRFFTDRCAIFYGRKHGVNIRYLVPPYLSKEEARIRREERWKVGIDDHIRWGKNWEPWDAETNPDGLKDFAYARGIHRRLPPKPARGNQADSRDRAFIDHLEATRGTVGLFSVSDLVTELGWNRQRVLRARKSCEKRESLQVWPGSPLGEGNGNKPHLFRFKISEEHE